MKGGRENELPSNFKKGEIVMSETQLKIFEREEFGEVRILDDRKTGKILFSGKDIATVLGYSNTKDAIRRHTKKSVKRTFLTSGGSQEMTFIPESDVYRLITHSKLPSAQKFEEWVFDEVLPSIRRDGYYINKQAMKLEIMEDLLSGYKELQPNKARFLHEDLIKTLKDQNKVLRAENSSLRRSLKISADRADDLEDKLTDVKENLINQLLGIEIEEK